MAETKGEVQRTGAFSGLIICVSGVSKEARRQVLEATHRLGGTYSPNLHPLCTHLLVQSFGGHKLQHAFKHGFPTRLFVVTLGWFIDSVNKNVKLSEVPYTIWSVGQLDAPMDDRFVNPLGVRDTGIPITVKKKGNNFEETGGLKSGYSGGIFELNNSQLFGQSIYIDLDVSVELHRKVVDVAAREGAVLFSEWFVGCGATYVVCEGSSIRRYLGHCDNIVSPIWVLKTSEERSMQRFIGLSADLARQLGLMLENLQHLTAGQEKCHEHVIGCEKSRASQKQRLQAVKLAKCGVRNRRARRLQSCLVPLRPINPSSLLDLICWSISEPPSKAAVYVDSDFSRNDLEFHKHGLSSGVEYVDSEAPFSNSLRALTESEKNEVVLKNHFLSILYPVDRFAEMGPSSRTYFSDTGFTRLQLLEFIYAFYQENMSDCEIEIAIHTDSRHAEELRSVYCSEETEQLGYIMHKRVDFLGSRKSFEMLKCVGGDNNRNVYELLMRE